MQWIIRRPKKKSKDNKSKHGYRLGTAYLQALRWKLVDLTSYLNADLVAFARDNEFRWTGDREVQASRTGSTPFETIVADPATGFEQRLFDILTDIAQVVHNALGLEHPRTSAPWRLREHDKDPGYLTVYFSLPGPNSTVNSPQYRRVDFILYEGSKPKGQPRAHYYRWAMDYMSPPGKLDVGVKIERTNVKTVKKVHQNIWVLEGNGSNPVDKVVIKVENFSQSLTFEEYYCQHRFISRLASRMFTNELQIVELEKAELLYFETIPVGTEVAATKELGEGNIGLARLAKDREKDNSAFLKMPYLEMGSNLADLIEHDVAGKWSKDLREILFDTGRMRALGRIAAFDLVVNNQDRFRPIEGTERNPYVTVMSKNIDFDKACQIVALDNVDPNNCIKFDEWPGKSALTGIEGFNQYVELAVENLITQIGAVNYYKPAGHWDGLDLETRSPWGSGVPKSVRGFDLRLMSWGDGTGVPTSGSNLVILGRDKDFQLHIRIFDAKGQKVTDTGEKVLPTPAKRFAADRLKDRVIELMPAGVPTAVQKVKLIREATSIVNRSLACVLVGVDEEEELLHIRTFDAAGQLVTDTDETKLLRILGEAISTLREPVTDTDETKLLRLVTDKAKLLGILDKGNEAISTLKEGLQGVRLGTKDSWISDVKAIISAVSEAEMIALQQAFFEGMRAGARTLKALASPMKESKRQLKDYEKKLFKLMIARIECICID